MPFTFSHPAIVLPLVKWSKKWFSTTGLIVGSLIPDFEYFIRMHLKSDYSHTLLGLIWFDIPLGLLVCYLFHAFVRNPIIENSPSFIQKRFRNYLDFNWQTFFFRNYLVVVISLFIGAFSHVLCTV